VEKRLDITGRIDPDAESQPVSNGVLVGSLCLGDPGEFWHFGMVEKDAPEIAAPRTTALPYLEQDDIDNWRSVTEASISRARKFGGWALPRAAMTIGRAWSRSVTSPKTTSATSTCAGWSL
jgi:hypothetical protein